VALTIDFRGGWEPRTKTQIEQALRKTVGLPPAGEKWVVSVVAAGLSQYCEVRVVTPNQRRSRLFFEDPANLPKAITEWIELYPLR
jgi:hypothetical protein